MTILSTIQIDIEFFLVIMCIIIFVLTMISEKDNKKSYKRIWFIDLLTVGLLLSDIFAIGYRGDTSTLGFYMVRVSNFLNFTFLYGIAFYICFCVDYQLKFPEKGRVFILIPKITSGLAIILNFINLFVPIIYSFDEENKYYRLNGWYVTSICLLVSIFMLSLILIARRKEMQDIVVFMLLLDIMMPFIASVLQIFIYGMAITNITFGITQIFLFMILYKEQVRTIKERDSQLEEYNARLLLSQVQPHFMLNTLSTIQYLCKSDSDAAVETISDFGVYLRNNMEFATTTKPISFEKEIAHIEKYVSIEKKRFGDRINVVYDIQEKHFELPALSIQPLVENAIKHGISKKKQGGTVEISSFKDDEDIHIVIKDNGKGFDMSKPFSEDRVHLGISMVESRLKKVCRGKLSISSEPDKGTVCEILIPIVFNVL